MGGVLGQYLQALEALRAEVWMVEVLHTGYQFPFHLLPPVSWKPSEFPPYSSRSVKAQAFQSIVGKMLWKWAPGVIENAKAGYYSRLFLLQEVSGRWRLVIILLSFNNCVNLTKFRMEKVSSVFGSRQKREYDVLHGPKGYWLSDYYPPRLSIILLLNCEWESIPVQGSLF